MTDRKHHKSIMKLALVFLAMLPLVLSGPVDKKRFPIEYQQLEDLANQLNAHGWGGMGQDACEAACPMIAGSLHIVCDTACTMARDFIANIPAA